MFYLGIGEGPDPCARAIAMALLPHAEARIEAHRGQGSVAVSAIPKAWGRARRGIRVCEKDGMVACAWARIDNGRDIARALGEVSGKLAQDVPLLIIEAYRKWGEETPRHLEGDFAFAILDPRNRTVFAARDAVGIRPLFWMQGETTGTGACATSIPALRHAARLLPDIDPDWVARFLAGASMSCEATPFPGILKVPPGHSLRIAGNGARVSRYCDLADEAVESEERESDLLERYRDLLDRATSARLAEHHSHGIEISGGLDSSTVLAFALRGQDGSDRQLHGFGWARHEQDWPSAVRRSGRPGIREKLIEAKRGFSLGRQALRIGADQAGCGVEARCSLGHLIGHSCFLINCSINTRCAKSLNFALRSSCAIVPCRRARRGGCA